MVKKPQISLFADVQKQADMLQLLVFNNILDSDKFDQKKRN